MILLSVRSTIQRDIQLHRESLEYLTKYFFAHDHQNYTILLPLYITTMQETEREHPDLWTEFMKGNFCETKGVAGFTPIAPDQGIEKKTGHLRWLGIVGIIQNEKALDKCLLSTRAVQITAWTCCIIRQWRQRQQNTTPPNHRREAFANDEECSETDRCIP